MFIYLDNSTTSHPKPTIVTDALRYAILNYVSPGRSAHSLGVNASAALSETRENLARFFNIKDGSKFIFTPGCTYSINIVLKGLKLEENDTVIISSLEHNALYRPLMSLQKKYNLNIITVPYAKHKGFEPYDVEKVLLKEKVKLIALAHASNVTGEILPLKRVMALSEKYGVKVLVDASQTVGNFPIDLNALNVDYFAFSAHKYLLGPPGIGVLYIKDPETLEPLIEGGTGSDSAIDRMPNYMPDRFEPGTLNLPSIWTINNSISYINCLSLENIYNGKRELVHIVTDHLSRIPNMEIYSPQRNNVGIIAFNLTGWTPQEVSQILDQKYGICVRSGLHCAPMAHKAIGTYPEGCVRASIGCFNTKDDLKAFVKALSEISESIK